MATASDLFSSNATVDEPWPKKETTPTDVSPVHLSSLDANSGAAFVRRLGLKIDSANAPRLHLFAWNVGARIPPPSSPLSPASLTPAAAPVVDIISQNELRSLAAVFFEKVDPGYGFIDRDHFLRQVSRRWLPSSSECALPEGPYDSVLCGLASFGFLFSRRQATTKELQLVESARIILEQNLMSETCSVDLITGWVLRVAYLRMTASPHATWMASCSLMHLIEAAGLHLELPSDNALIRSTENNCDPEIRRRLFGMARHLNVWVSFELGRSRVVLHGATSLPPTPRPNGYMTEIFNLLPVSESLDPNRTQDAQGLETALSDVIDAVYIQPPLILAQCNLMLTIYRRLRALNSTVSGKLLDRALALIGKALRATHEMIATNSPWHQIANVPFQIICTLLSIDNRASLVLLGDAMQALGEVTAAYDTDVMREAYSTAYLLILLHQRRKEQDTQVLGDVLRVNSAASVPHADPGASTTTQSDALPDSAEFSWLGELMIDMPSLQNFDIEQFLMTDVPWPFPETGI
ncbi:hypothetical protein MW887_007100 [Aspergillus wentii]|nr:hypothetical protein MW887_007100 [Aspergillus wentii]